jgi:hypothetical protein
MYPFETKIDPEPPPCSQRIILWTNGEGTSQLNDNISRLCDTYIEEPNNNIGHNFYTNKSDSNSHHHTKNSTTHHFTLPKTQHGHMNLNSSSFNMDTQVKIIQVTDITSHCLDSLCGEIHHIVNNSLPSGTAHTDQSKYSTLTMKMSEESNMENVIVDRKISRVKPSMVSINNLHSTPVRKLTSSWCTSTPTSSTSFQLSTVNMINLLSHQQHSATISCNNPDNSLITNCDNDPITVPPTASE